MATATATQVPTWQLDATHSSIEFSVKHMMMTTVRGRFKDVQATLTGDRDHPEAAGVEAAIAVASIDTGVADRDAHLRAADFFDAERFPHITFRSTRIDGTPPKQEGDHFRLAGDLVIRDSAMEVILDCEYDGRGTDPLGEDASGIQLPDGARPARVGTQVEPGARDGRRAGREHGPRRGRASVR